MVSSMSAPCIVAFGKYSDQPLRDAFGVPFGPMLLGICGLVDPIPISNMFVICVLLFLNSLWYVIV